MYLLERDKELDKYHFESILFQKRLQIDFILYLRNVIKQISLTN